MPEARNRYRLERGAASTVPSVTEVLRRRQWTQQAACASEPYSDWTWVSEPSGAYAGRYPASAVVRLLELCATCPVRRRCAVEALSEQAYSVMGVWGGALHEDRKQALRIVADEMRGTPIELPGGPGNEDGTVSSSLGVDPYFYDPAALVERAADLLESTFTDRLEHWRAAVPKPTRRPYKRCGSTFEGFRRRRTYCSETCAKQANRRPGAAAKLS